MTGGEPRVLSAGMTGGIACGRTTVGKIFTRFGACVVDMDAVSHTLIAPGGAAVGPVVAAFGTRFQNEAGGVDRKVLGALVFHDAKERARLEAILHPMILAETEK
ncbi:MAG TPA: dephospho-CoA kinase, partial [Candidatus Polarisedimenticolia bacterium]|nr:dephospho-CoA kinase [Candidatus Polarisedimenticolia bacterium]